MAGFYFISTLIIDTYMTAFPMVFLLTLNLTRKLFVNERKPFLGFYVSNFRVFISKSLFFIIMFHDTLWKGYKMFFNIMAFHDKYSLIMLSFFEMQRQFSKSTYGSVNLLLLSKDFLLFQLSLGQTERLPPFHWGPLIWKSLKSPAGIPVRTCFGLFIRLI